MRKRLVKLLAITTLSAVLATGLSACGNKTTADTSKENVKVETTKETAVKTSKKKESLTDINVSTLLDKTTVLNSCSIILGETNISMIKEILGDSLPSSEKSFYFWGTPYEVTNETDDVMKAHVKKFPADGAKDYLQLVTLDDGTIINIIINYGKESEVTYELNNIPKDMTGTQLEEKFDTERSPYGGQYIMDNDEVEIYINPYINEKYSKENTMHQIQKKLNAVGIGRLKESKQQ